MKLSRFGRGVVTGLFVLGALIASRAGELNVFAAASLSDALQEIAKTYEAAGGDTVRYNFGGSSVLALQIKQGAPAEVFFSADEAKMDDLAKAGLIEADTRRSLLSNTLVIVVNAERGVSLSTPEDLAGSAVRRIALAETRTVPAGIYAREWLEKKGLWTKMAERVIPVENVRGSLAAVESGNVDAGIVYKTDALISQKVKIAYEVVATDGPRISYPVAVLKEARNAAAARAFVRFLTGAEAQAIFTKYGFLPAR